MLQLKTELPRQRVALVERPELLESLQSFSSARLILVVAPPGFGKTTLLTHWVDHIRAGGAVASWLTLDEDDADPRQFFTGVVASLTRAGVRLTRFGSPLERGLEEISIDAVQRHLVESLGEDGRSIHIVLDDYHRAASMELDAVLLRFVQALPGNVHLVLGSRARPNIGIPQLLASGLAAELNAGDLRLTAEESRRLLNVETLSPELETLIEHVEGWPVALRLARLAMGGKSDLSASLRQLTGRGSHLSNYLAEELLGMLPPEQARFLLETAIFERFDVQLADAVRERDDSWAVLEKLEPLQSLITQIEGEEVWYRYHHLFADYLRAELLQRHPARVAELHSRASRAFEARGFFIEAVRHAAGAGDYERCVDLIAEAGGWKMVLYGRRNDLASALRHLPHHVRVKYPRMIAADAYLKLKMGNLAGANSAFQIIPNVLEQKRDWHTISDEDRDVFNVGILVHGYGDNELTPANFARCEAMLGEIPSSEALTRGVLQCEVAISALAIGHSARAEELAVSAMGSMRDASSVLGLNYCYLHAGLAALYRGELKLATAYLTQSRNMAEENFGEDSGLKSLSDVLWGNLQLWRWEALDARDDYSNAFQHVREYDGWFEIYAAALDTTFRTAWMRDDVEGMERALAAGSEIVRDRNLQRLELLVHAFRFLMLRSTGDRQEARRLAVTLMDALPIGCWKARPHLWRPYQEAGFALLRGSDQDNVEASEALADDLLACTEQMGLVIYRVRALVLRALVRERAGRRTEALADLSQALDLGCREDLRLPFIEQAELEPLLRLAKRQDRMTGGRSAVGQMFLSSILDSSREVTRERSGLALRGLSPRELEVAQEIGLGYTNKEIARSLDLTEHTVKFHLRNIFAKLGVDRRAHVQALFSDTRQTR